jgi:hypothetical protein
MLGADFQRIDLTGYEVAQAIRVRYRQSCLEQGIELPGYADYFPGPASSSGDDLGALS